MMSLFFRSLTSAVTIAVAVQLFTVGVLAPQLPLPLCPPGVEVTRELTIPKARLVRISNSDGAVTVDTHDGDEIKLAVDIRAYTTDALSRAIAEDYVDSLIQVNTFLGYVYIVTETEQRPDTIDLQADYRVLVPEGVDIGVESTNGNVFVGAGCGRVTVVGKNTDVEVVDPGGLVQAKSTNGRIRVIGARDVTDLETVNGSIYTSMRAGRLRASTANGTIFTELTGDGVNVCDLTSTNGNIKLVMNENPSAAINAHTERGTVRSELAFESPDGIQRRSMAGTIGNAAMNVSLNSFNGNILIARSDS